ncbi:hypothetical protein J5N97_014695 [Dioscorea zingiberensis]|uniref:Uncharacterized protein n=1 Tax=Dioscorea zingiberensis TaxID=325984 RepID=A0A9D5CSY0_9LILI|nr:hypothetical protein J5N97_014695 [Dioscorea zingiberensis]
MQVKLDPLLSSVQELVKLRNSPSCAIHPPVNQADVSDKQDQPHVLSRVDLPTITRSWRSLLEREPSTKKLKEVPTCSLGPLFCKPHGLSLSLSFSLLEWKGLELELELICLEDGMCFPACYKICKEK